jgi:hypothetical protein
MEMVQVQVRKTNDGYIVTEPDGTERLLCNLYYGQMINSYKGRHYYSREIPADYLKKAAILRAHGWETGYHYEDWYELEKGWTEYGGIRTDDAMKKLRKQAGGKDA